MEHKLHNPLVTEIDAQVIIGFSWSDILFHQTEVQAIWRRLNLVKAKPVAKTFLGRITSIQYQKDKF